jgi:hypothetical protein
MVSRVAQEDTSDETWEELMWHGDNHVRVARTTKDVQMLIGGRGTKQSKMRTRSLNHRGRRFNS